MKYFLLLFVCFFTVTPVFFSVHSAPTPTPVLRCGYNNQLCCPNNKCLNSGDTCYHLYTWALGGSFCMNPAQYAAWKTATQNKDDLVNRFCTANGVYPGVRTALGCIPSTPKGLINLIVAWTAFLGGGTALLTIFYAGFIMTTAGGDVKKVNSAKHTITYAVIGLAIIILAVIILNFIGVRIFGLNNFGFGV